MAHKPKRMRDDSGSSYRNMKKRYEGNSEDNSMGKKKRKSKGKLNIIFKILTLVYIAITILFYIAVIRLDLLPNNYIIIFTVVLGILTVLIATGLAKTHKTKKLNVFCLIIAIIFSVAYVFATNYVNATREFLNSMFTAFQETDEYYVVVRSESAYDSLDDIAGEEVYSFLVDEEIQEDLSEEVSVTFSTSENLLDLANNLLDETIDVVFVSSSQYNMLSDELEDFEDNTKIIYTVTHIVESTAEISSEGSDYTIENGIFNVYISGIDTSGSINKVSRSDVNMIVTVNTNTHEILLTSIPRDYYVTLHSKGAKDKLTHSGIYGINETVTTVEDLLNIDINYYVRVNFTTVINLVDTIGGIEVYSEYAFTAQGYSFSKGYNTLNGAQALAFSRERYSFASGDNQRVKNQQAVMEAIIEKTLSSTTLLTRYTSILSSLEGSFQTNIEQDEISELVKEQLNNMSSWNISTNSLTGTGSYGSTYSMGSTQLYIMLPDNDSVSEATALINKVLGQ